MTYVIRTLSACHLHMHTLSAHHPQTHTSSAHQMHTHVTCHMSSAHAYIIGTLAGCTLSADAHIVHRHHPHTYLSCPISCSTTPGVMCMSSTCHLHIILISSACYPHIISRCAHHPHIICRSTHHFQQSLWTPIVFSVSKILIIDVTVVPDVVPDVVLLKIYCLHIIPSCPHGPRGPQLCFLFQR